jgi:hypothetical protein
MRKQFAEEHGDTENRNNDEQNDEYDYFNHTIDGFPCAGLVVETLNQDFTVLQNCPEKQSSMKSPNNIYVSFAEYGLERIVDKRKRNKGR